ncbi:MAG: hypothetical protein HY547_09825 [Elusimicrobia bacterium]|nr:hypothetical protein [Elusimicrobiota bacterium]
MTEVVAKRSGKWLFIFLAAPVVNIGCLSSAPIESLELDGVGLFLLACEASAERCDYKELAKFYGRYNNAADEFKRNKFFQGELVPMFEKKISDIKGAKSFRATVRFFDVGEYDFKTKSFPLRYKELATGDWNSSVGVGFPGVLRVLPTYDVEPPAQYGDIYTSMLDSMGKSPNSEKEANRRRLEKFIDGGLIFGTGVTQVIQGMYSKQSFAHTYVPIVPRVAREEKRVFQGGRMDRVSSKGTQEQEVKVL